MPEQSGKKDKNKKSLQKKHDKQNELYKHHLAVNKGTQATLLRGECGGISFVF